MRLEPLYTLRFFYPQGWNVDLKGKKGTEEEHYFFAEGLCEGRISGKFRGANHPHRRTDETFMMNMQGFIETKDSGLIMVDYQGYGRSRERSDELYALTGKADQRTKFRRQIVGVAKHIADSEKFRWLNDTVCAISGEVRAPIGVASDQVKQADVKLIFMVAEIIWEAPPE